jgi:hypothetical protein
VLRRSSTDCPLSISSSGARFPSLATGYWDSVAWVVRQLRERLFRVRDGLGGLVRRERLAVEDAYGAVMCRPRISAVQAPSISLITRSNSASSAGATSGYASAAPRANASSYACEPSRSATRAAAWSVWGRERKLVMLWDWTTPAQIAARSSSPMLARVAIARSIAQRPTRQVGPEHRSNPPRPPTPPQRNGSHRGFCLTATNRCGSALLHFRRSPRRRAP